MHTSPKCLCFRRVIVIVTGTAQAVWTRDGTAQGFHLVVWGRFSARRAGGWSPNLADVTLLQACVPLSSCVARARHFLAPSFSNLSPKIPGNQFLCSVSLCPAFEFDLQLVLLYHSYTTLLLLGSEDTPSPSAASEWDCPAISGLSLPKHPSIIIQSCWLGCRGLLRFLV